MLISVVAQKKWKIFQMDVNSTFLNGHLEEEVYIDQPLGFVVQGHEEKVYKLKNVLHRLKQAPRAWNSKIDGFLTKISFISSPSEASLYVKKNGTDFMIVCLYVDDLIYCGTCSKMTDKFKQLMKKEFEMIDLGLMRYFLKIQVKQKKKIYPKKNI